MLSDLLILAPAFVVFAILLVLRFFQTDDDPQAVVLDDAPQPAVPDDAAEEGPPTNAIVVDGSNVMHWGGEPSAQVLSLVLRSLEQHGYAPIVFFDASAGYRLGDRYFDELRLAQLTGVRKEHICVVHKGTIADEAILAFSKDHKLRVVTNDRYRDWRVQFPHASKKGRLLRGTFAQGGVKWRGSL